MAYKENEGRWDNYEEGRDKKRPLGDCEGEEMSGLADELVDGLGKNFRVR